MTDTFWNGEPAVAVRGTGLVQPSSLPAFWGKDLTGKRVPVVKVVYGRHTFYLYDDGGAGWAKVTSGHGSPRLGHRNLTVAGFRVEAA